jgi:hypothetical protein
MESIEKCQRKCHVAQKGPKYTSIKRNLFMLSINRLNFERLDDPHCEITYNEKCYKFSARLLTPKLLCIAASPETIDDAWGLQDNLDYLDLVRITSYKSLPDEK